MEASMPLSPPPPPANPSLLALLERSRATLVCAALVGGVLGIGLASALPAWYEATTHLAVIPVDDPTGGQSTNALDGSTATLPIVVAVLRSRTVAEEAVKRLGLVAAWRAHSREEARERLIAHVTIATDRKLNLITLSAEDRSPARARAIAAAVADAAAARVNELWSARSRDHRKRLEAELDEVAARLSQAEEAMRAFRERTHVVDLPTQVKATVDQAAALERLSIDKQLALRFAQKFGDGDAVEVQRQRAERDDVLRELDQLRHARSAGPLLGLDQLPQLELEQARLRRELDTLGARHDLLALKVNQLRAAEARPGGRAEVIDAPVEPRTRSRPSALALFGQCAVAAALTAALGLVAAARRKRPSLNVAA
jgi:uncharacterized protein involved in exopolysaccharide biosynthesis